MTLNLGVKRFGLGLLANLALLAVPALAHNAQILDNRVEQLVRHDSFAGAVLVVRGDEVLLNKAYGHAVREWAIPNQPDTRFWFASVGKQFTSAAILKLRDEGLIDIDAPIKNYLPDTPAHWDRITARHLMSNSSGIPDFVRDPDFPNFVRVPHSREALFARFRDKPLSFEPGSRYSYSNSGYMVLTELIERLSGKSYADYIDQTFLKPLGMLDTGYDDRRRIVSKLAQGYTQTLGGVEPAHDMDESLRLGAGGHYSTTGDLLKWNRALYSGQVISPASLEQMMTVVHRGYALGLEIDAEDDRLYVSHDGGGPGVNTFLGYEVNSQTTVVMLGNLNGYTLNPVGRDLTRLALGDAVEFTETTPRHALDSEALRDYEGDYLIGSEMLMQVRLVAGELLIEPAGQEVQKLIRDEKPDQFLVVALPFRFSFERDDNGAVSALILHQGGREHRGARQ